MGFAKSEILRTLRGIIRNDGEFARASRDFSCGVTGQRASGGWMAFVGSEVVRRALLGGAGRAWVS
jgi:hypothetical protein